MSPLTEKQAAVLGEIKRFIARHGKGPTYREIADALGINYDAVMTQTTALVRKELILLDFYTTSAGKQERRISLFSHDRKAKISKKVDHEAIIYQAALDLEPTSTFEIASNTGISVSTVEYNIIKLEQKRKIVRKKCQNNRFIVHTLRKKKRYEHEIRIRAWKDDSPHILSAIVRESGYYFHLGLKKIFKDYKERCEVERYM